MTHQVGIDFPYVDEQGISDPVTLFDEWGRLHIAQWDNNKKEWFEIVDGVVESYGSQGMHWWTEIQFPHGWVYDSEFYSNDVSYRSNEAFENAKALAMMGLRRPGAIDIDKVMADIKKTINESV